MGTISGLKGPLYDLYDLCTCRDLFRQMCILSCFKERKTSRRNFIPTTVTKFMANTTIRNFKDKKKKKIRSIQNRVNQVFGVVTGD